MEDERKPSDESPLGTRAANRIMYRNTARVEYRPPRRRPPPRGSDRPPPGERAAKDRGP